MQSHTLLLTEDFKELMKEDRENLLKGGLSNEERLLKYSQLKRHFQGELITKEMDLECAKASEAACTDFWSGEEGTNQLLSIQKQQKKHNWEIFTFREYIRICDEHLNVLYDVCSKEVNPEGITENDVPETEEMAPIPEEESDTPGKDNNL